MPFQRWVIRVRLCSLRGRVSAYSAVFWELGVELKTYEFNEEILWQPGPDHIPYKLTQRTRGIVLMNPNNPTGSMCTRRMLEQVRAAGNTIWSFSLTTYDKLVLAKNNIFRSRGCAGCPGGDVRRPIEDLLALGLAAGMGRVSGDWR